MSRVLLLLCLTQILFGKTVYIAPYPGTNTSVTFYHPKSSIFAKKWVCLREALEKSGYLVEFTFDAKELHDVAAIISFTNINPTLLKNLASYPKDLCWLFAFEPPVFLPKIYDKSLSEIFGKIFVMFDDLVDDETYFKFYYPQPMQEMKWGIADFSQRKFCALVAANKHSSHEKELYSERKKIIEYFSHSDDFDLYGPGWEGYSRWKGIAKNKQTLLENYRFAICYENMGEQKGYITEKIFDCFVSGCIPIYLGASNIADYIPKECFIDRRKFTSDQDLFNFLKKMERETYEGYIQAIRRYFTTPKAKLFSIDHFIGLIQKSLIELEKNPPIQKIQK